jgi:D-lactate dehydrogenase
VPELNKSATQSEIEELNGCEIGYSTSRTCEVGMMSGSNIDYISIAHLVKDYLAQSVN